MEVIALKLGVKNSIAGGKEVGQFEERVGGHVVRTPPPRTALKVAAGGDLGLETFVSHVSLGCQRRLDFNTVALCDLTGGAISEITGALSIVNTEGVRQYRGRTQQNENEQERHCVRGTRKSVIEPRSN